MSGSLQSASRNLKKNSSNDRSHSPGNEGKKVKKEGQSKTRITLNDMILKVDAVFDENNKAELEVNMKTNFRGP